MKSSNHAIMKRRSSSSTARHLIRRRDDGLSLMAIAWLLLSLLLFFFHPYNNISCVAAAAAAVDTTTASAACENSNVMLPDPDIASDAATTTTTTTHQSTASLKNTSTTTSSSTKVHPSDDKNQHYSYSTLLSTNTEACDCPNIIKKEATIIIPQPDLSIVGYPVSRFKAMDRRSLDVVNTVRPEHSISNPLNVSVYEWQQRTELAAAYRALHLLGLETNSVMGSDQAAQCLMLRLDDSQINATTEIQFLMADWGIWFEEVTASNLLKFTTDGLLVDTKGNWHQSHPVTANSGCIPVAKAIFEARSDVKMIVHIHPYAVMAVGGTKHGLLPLSQAAFFLWGQVSREDYDFSYESNFESTLAQGFAKGQRAMLLNHHGMYAVGRDVAEGLFVATHLTQACEVQIRTLSMVGGDLSKVLLPSSDQLSTQFKEMMDSTDYSYDGSREWPGIVRKVQRQAPDYNT